jgi:hypothetical protein
MKMGDPKRILLLFSKLALLTLPLLLLTLLYVICDPFKVIKTDIDFENYYDHQPYELNREFMSTELFLKNYPKYHYNSFILGSCESFVYRADSWKKYIDVDQGEVFHFPAASESLYGMYLKIKYLDKTNIPIKNCLMIMDISTFKDIQPKHDYLHTNHPAMSGESSTDFQLGMFKSFFSNFFCLQYAYYKFSGKVHSSMKGNFGIAPGQIRTTTLNNEYYYEKYDVALKSDSIAFYEKNLKQYYYRDTSTKRHLQQTLFQERHYEILNELRDIFAKHNTHFKIVLSPMYDQMYFNPADIDSLKSIFGEQNLHDYSGINRFTENISYYYDNFHYKPMVANEILEEIYNESN